MLIARKIANMVGSQSLLRRIPLAAKANIPRRCSSRGFTLLELVTVLFVVSILLALSLPIASSLARRFRVGGARDAFVNTYAKTRAAAIQYGREGRLHILAAEGRFWVEVDTGGPGAMATDTIGRVVDVFEEYTGVTMFSPRQVLCFDSRGLSYSGGLCEPHDAEIVFKRVDRADTVQLSLGGTVVRR